MGKDFETVLIFTATPERRDIFLDQFSKAMNLIADCKVKGVAAPSSVSFDNRLLEGAKSVSTLLYSDREVKVFELEPGMWAFGVYSRHHDIRDLVRMVWSEPVVLIEDCSEYGNPRLVNVWFDCAEEVIPDDWGSHFEHAVWLNEHFNEVHSLLYVN